MSTTVPKASGPQRANDPTTSDNCPKSQACRVVSPMSIDTARRLRAAVFGSVLVPVGLGCKLWYTGPGAYWIANLLGGVLYVWFWCLVAVFALPRVRAERAAFLVLAVTCVLECLQLWHPPFLQAVRGTFVGRTLIGSEFDWMDFPHYLAGALLGWRSIMLVQKRERPAD